MIPGSLPSQRRSFALAEIEGLNYFRSVRWLDSIGSTNKTLLDEVRGQRVSVPALLVADRQTAGAGRGGNVWWSPSGCLMFSIAVPLSFDQAALASPDSTALDSALSFTTTSAHLLPLRVGCMIADCLESLVTLKPMVKWPNDVYLDDRKVSGILIEVVQGKGDSVAIIGIGINCQVEFTDAPKEISSRATSVHQWTKDNKQELASIESVLIQFLHQWTTSLHCPHDTEATTSFLERWPSRSLLHGRWVRIQLSSTIVEGRCIGINFVGALLLQTERLEVIEIIAGTVIDF
jgi:BirA family transcriptional regulator, biotin operon repressor / biotin---[acetyl-CoA-carboxylase] ligase